MKALVALLLLAGVAAAEEPHVVRMSPRQGVPYAYMVDPPPDKRLVALARSPKIELAVASMWLLRHPKLEDERPYERMLLEALASDDPRRAGVAAVIAARSEMSVAVRRALEGLCRGEGHPIVRANACDTVGAGFEGLLATGHPYALMIGLRRLPKDASLHRVLPLLAHPEPHLRALAVRWLAAAADSIEAPAAVRAAAVAACRDGIHDATPSIRAYAAALAWIDLDWRAVDDVLPLLDDAAVNHHSLRHPAIGFDGDASERYEMDIIMTSGGGVRAWAAAELEARFRGEGFTPSRPDVDTSAAELKAWWAAHRAEKIGR